MLSIAEILFPPRELFNITHIASFVIKQNQITDLMNCVFGADKKLSDRALWVMSHCSDLEPTCIKPYYEKLILKLNEGNLSDAFKRNTLHLFLNNEIPTMQQSFMLNICYRYLQNSTEAIAVRALCIPIIFYLSKPYPELIQELTLVLRHILSQENPPALLAKARIVLKQIEKMKR